RIEIIKTGHITDIQDAVLHAIDPAPAIRPLIRREAEGMRHPAGWITIIRKLPEFFHAQAVNLRLTSFVEPETLNEILGQGTANAFTQDRDLGEQIHAGF